MTGAVYAFQKMAFEALNASPAIASGRVYEHVPERAVFPYVTFTGGESADVSGYGNQDKEVRLTIHVWTQQEGYLEAQTIAEAIYDRLHRVSLEQSATWRAVFNYERDRVQMMEPDGRTRRVVCRYTAYMERL